MGWHGNKAWRAISGWLAVSERHDFARRSLRLLRHVWPELHEAPASGRLDRSGIDLLVPSDDDRIPVAIQCKGFQRDEVASGQVAQAQESIEAFLASGLRVDRFVLVHNRDGSSRLRERLRPLLDECVARGAALRADLWDRETIIDAVFEDVATRIHAAIARSTDQLFGHFERLFVFRRAQLSEVPVRRFDGIFHRDAAAEIVPRDSLDAFNVAEALRRSSGLRWTILTGSFGTGKTTAALAAARDAASPTVFVPVVAIAAEVFRSGKRSDLLSHVNELLGIENDVDPSEANLSRIAASVFGHIVRVNGSRVTFILDGLDEHHELATRRGVAQLFNQLADFQGPVVLTTRREHLDAMIGAFGTGISELALRFGKERHVDILELQPWRQHHALAVIDGAIGVAAEEEAVNLRDLRAAVESGEASQLYGDLVLYPLFLQFILEDVAETGLRRRNRAELVHSFAERKIRRDLARWVPDAAAFRIAIFEELDPEAQIATTMRAMENLAATMVAEDGALIEEVDENVVRRVFSETFRHPVEIVPVLLNSLLMTRAPRTISGLPIGFALRVFQEFFLAAWMVREGCFRPAMGADLEEFVIELEKATVPTERAALLEPRMTKDPEGR